MADKAGKIIKTQLFTENQVLRQVLGICSSLAVTNSMSNSLVMGLGLSFVTALSSMTLSAMREIIPHRVRMLAQTLVIAVYVILVDLFLKAYLPDISKTLGPYVGLIITNCIIMGRAEAYAQKNPPVPALIDGFFAGLGYTGVLLIISLIREVLGFGTVFGMNINFAGFQTWTIMIMPPAAFFIIGALIWFLGARAAKKTAKAAK
ncbi:MAG: electron transport complex subunit RsxE [Clostridiales bacterium]|jgi:Na+-transporting NADH:ubiquinone oxidoreductase subunit D|nr:electron transport complex subunit RsxE [Clostridia bacterium]NLD02925.1 electron transport complex subunit RsxE [Clostridiales bacterium]